MTIEFKTHQFSSGEYDVKIVGRVYENDITIEWNWFNLMERDVFQILLKIDAIKRTYPSSTININAPYLPYMRQDRLFEAGQSVPSYMLVALLKQSINGSITTMANHSFNADVKNVTTSVRHVLGNLGFEVNNFNVVLPDANADKHYQHTDLYFPKYVFHKVRNDDGVKLEFYSKPNIVHTEFTFLIVDDICAGGRTFIECAKALRENFTYNINIELMVYHAFLDYGIGALKEAGITKIYIINKDSYDYIMNLYPNEQDYFVFASMQNKNI